MAHDNCSFTRVFYPDLQSLIRTSSIVERLFSKAGCALHDRRMTLLPANLESQLFLHLNKDLLSVSDFV